MAYDVNVGLDYSGWTASTDLSTKQFYFVSLNSSKQVAVSGSNVHSVGILQDKPNAAGRAAQVRYGGISKVQCGGTFAAGDLLASDSNGKAVKYTAATVSAGTPEPLAGSIVLGIACEAGVSGQVSTILLQPSGLHN